MKLTTHAEVKAIHDLRREARESGMYVVEKANAFLLYRATAPNNVLVGKRSSLAGLKRLVKAAAGRH